MSELSTRIPYIACCLKGGTVYLIPVISTSEKKSSYTSFSDIIICHCPVESDESDDGCIRFVHGFTAGNISIKKWNRQKRKNISSSSSSHRRKINMTHSYEASVDVDVDNVVDQSYQLNDDVLNGAKCTSTVCKVFRKVPILAHSWGAGIMDIYSCEDFGSQSKSSKLNKKHQLMDALYQSGSIETLVLYLRTRNEDQIPVSKVWRDAWHECHKSSIDVDSMVESVKNGDQFQQIRHLLLCVSNGKER